MDRPRLHLCIATGQNLANLIPALQLNATEVVILETPAMKASAANLKCALESHGVKVERRAFDDSTPKRITEEATALAIHLGERPLVFNATGGHKLMTLALSRELPVGDELHLLYLETHNSRIDWLLPEAATEPMQDVLKIDDVLLAQGFRRLRDGSRDVAAQQASQLRLALTRRLGDEAKHLARFFGTLNKLASSALKDSSGSTALRQEFDFTPGGRNAEVLLQAKSLGLIHWDGDVELVFLDRNAATYFSGGWLEEYVATKLRGLKPTDHAVNLAIEVAGSGTENEIDAFAIHNNRALLIECKTTRFGIDANKDQSYVYKLAQLTQRVGGSLGRSLLLSARRVQPDVMQRAKEYNVDVLAAEDLGQFVDYFKAWMTQRL